MPPLRRLLLEKTRANPCKRISTPNTTRSRIDKSLEDCPAKPARHTTKKAAVERKNLESVRQCFHQKFNARGSRLGRGLKLQARPNFTSCVCWTASSLQIESRKITARACNPVSGLEFKPGRNFIFRVYSAQIGFVRSSLTVFKPGDTLFFASQEGHPQTPQGKGTLLSAARFLDS